jgi:hypothetical protein
MLIVASKEQIQYFLEEEIKCWETVGGGPNLNAFDFDPKITDPQVLKQLGYYENRESWLAGARIKALRAYIQALNTLPEYKGK